ncbi:MAG TPA: hypothetical protein PKY81_01550 [bacterium]|nr:hypothetical protein [bacterium]HPN29620.1 hypothetical protein [bacterium]
MKKNNDYANFFQSEKTIMFRESALEQLSKREELDALFVHYNISKNLIYCGYALLFAALAFILKI